MEKVLVHLQWFQCTCVRVKADSGMEPLPSFKHVQSEVDLWTVPLPLDSVESVLKVEPETDLL